MNLNRLRTLRELSIRSTMAAVADALYLTPSAVSQQITQLEEDFGIALVERIGRRVQLTSAGHALVGHAEQILEALDQACSDIEERKNVVSGEVRIAAFPSVASALLPHVIRDLRQAHPLLKVVFMERGADEGLEALHSWMVDIALTDSFVGMPAHEHQGLQKTLLLEDEVRAWLPRDHPLATKNVIRLAELKNESWALESTSNSFAQFVRERCLSVGFEPNLNGYCKSVVTVEAMVASSGSVSVIPGLFARKPHPDIVVRRLEPKLVRSIYLMYRKTQQQRPAVQAVVKALQHSAANYQNDNLEKSDDACPPPQGSCRVS